jgi:hypothetical protein
LILNFRFYFGKRIGTALKNQKDYAVALIAFVDNFFSLVYIIDVLNKGGVNAKSEKNLSFSCYDNTDNRRFMG